jgi:formylglycine-generating enzyme required for sulfatase activity
MFCWHVASGQDQGAAAKPPDLKGSPAALQAAAKYEAQKQQATQKYEAALDEARKQYLAVLKKEQAEQAKKHNADLAQQLEAAIQQLDAESVEAKKAGKAVKGAAGGAKEMTVDLGGGTTMKFVRIQPGEFLMGSPAGEAGRFDNETPHKVKITKAFMLGTTLVTQAQWNLVMGNPAKGDEAPVDAVLWDEAVQFCQKLGQKDGKHYRLPTEAEWEYACRAGTTTTFNSGDSDATLGEVAWFGANSEGHKHPVAGKKPNAWGLYDMHGDLWEWCGDWYGDYPPGDAVDPAGAAQGAQRVLRGGSWEDAPRFLRAAFRQKFNPGQRDICLGVRCAADVP